jgi:hypothetical protein
VNSVIVGTVDVVQVVGTVDSEMGIVDFEQSFVGTVVAEVEIDEDDLDSARIDHGAAMDQDAETECCAEHDQVIEIAVLLVWEHVVLDFQPKFVDFELEDY